jgi:protein-tyrosine kinase
MFSVNQKSTVINQITNAASATNEALLRPDYELSDTSRRLGAILVENGAISLDQAATVIEIQRNTNELFGALAVKLGYCNVVELNSALILQNKGQKLLARDRSKLAPHIQAILSDSKLRSQFSQGMTHLELRWFTGAAERKCLSFVADGINQGCSTAIAIMAILFAQNDRKVLLIDAAGERSSQMALLGIQEPEIYLEDVLENPKSCTLSARPLAPLELQVLSSRSPKDAVQSLHGKQFARVLEVASTIYDIVLIDTPPISERGDAYTLAMRTSGAVAVVRLQKSRDSTTRQLLHNLSDAGIEIVGTIGTHF